MTPTRPPADVLGTPDSFRWAVVPASDRDWLRARTDDIGTFTYRIGCDIARVGQILAQVRGRLKHGLFLRWLAAETTFDRAKAYRLMQIGKAFSSYISQIEKFEQSALYVLSQDKTPQAAREHAVQLAESGTRVTRAVALQILDAHKPVRVGTVEVAEYEKLHKELNTLVIEVPASKTAETDLKAVRVDQDKVTAQLEKRDAVRYEAIGRALVGLAGEMTNVRIEMVDDHEGVPVYAVTCHGADHTPRVVVDRKLRWALERVAGMNPSKFCPGCCLPGQMVPVGQFSDNNDMDDELSARCKACEKSRRKAGRERAKLEREAQAPNPAA